MDRKTMVKKKHEERGFILVLGMIISSFLLLLVVPFMFKVSTERTLINTSMHALSALSLAEAGIERAIWEMNEGDISTWSGDGDLRTMDISEFQASGGNVIGDIHISITDPLGDNPALVATGTVADGSQTIARTVRVELQFNYPIPAPENAISFFGSPSKHATLAIMDHDGAIAGKVLISGFDKSGGPDRLALGIEDTETLNSIIVKLGESLDIGGDLEGVFVGDPRNDVIYQVDPEKSFDASIGLANPSDFIDCEIMETYIQQLAANAHAMTPTQTIDLEGKDSGDAFIDPDGDGYVNLGGTEDDVVLLTGGRLILEGDLTIEGKGTLIFDGGKMEMKSVGSFNWDGDIYVLGSDSKGDAEFKIKKGMYDIIGDIYVIGEGNGNAKIEFNNDDTEENNSYTHLTGSVLAAGGSGDNSKAEFKVKNGDVDIEGMIALYGNKTKLEFRQQHHKGGRIGDWLNNDDSDIRIAGGISLMVPDASKKGTTQKAEIKIHDHKTSGDDLWEGIIEILYDSDVVRAAVKRLSQKVGLLGKFSVVSWQQK